MIALGLDPGLKHLGIALADGPLARPLPPLLHRDFPTTLRALLALIQQHQVDRVVIGLPEGPIAPFAQRLAALLASQTSIPVILHDETLSSHQALAQLRAANASRAKLRAAHSFAACLILEDYLESAKL